uniref:NAD(P)-dependent oxidoreductase n=1 Tax=Roseihalotalea indica TaxID=2867963 RepID=A0AA49GTI3_9BACT|nr:NAD(P)-dependent oxidoreductase [Tunicatimonas sp. TK19036]
MKLLITGSSGHLGEALVRSLQGSDHQVAGVDVLPSDFTNLVGSIADRAFVKQCMDGVEAVIHTATLHKPHIVTHSYQDFVDTNITGTLNLLEEAALAGVKSFVFTSTTSTFGDAMTPAPEAPAAWVTEEVTPIPKNIYGVTKTAAEDLCRLFYRNHGLPCLILRTSRFFPEEDDQQAIREGYQDDNVKINELLYRRVDLADVVSAHLLALKKAPILEFGRYIISATSPFTVNDLAELHRDAPAVVKRKFPDYDEVYAQRGWNMFPRIDRVYVNELARTELGWQPLYDFQYALDCLKAGETPFSPLARLVTPKGYHAQKFSEGPYPVD